MTGGPGVMDWVEPERWPVWVEPKADGFYCEAQADMYGRWSFTSRGGEVLRLPEIAAELAGLGLRNVTLVGELVGTHYSVVAAGGTRFARLLLFDYLRTVGIEHPQPHHERLRDVLAVPDGPRVERLSRHGRLRYSIAEVGMAYAGFRAAGWEGLVAKDRDAEFGGGCWRMKPEITVDGVIVGLAEGRGRLAGACGALLVDVDGVVTRVGIGLSLALRLALWAIGDGCLGAWVEFRAQERLASGRYRHPRFERLRPDKGGPRLDVPAWPAPLVVEAQS